MPCFVLSPSARGAKKQKLAEGVFATLALLCFIAFGLRSSKAKKQKHGGKMLEAKACYACLRRSLRRDAKLLFFASQAMLLYRATHLCLACFASGFLSPKARGAKNAKQACNFGVLLRCCACIYIGLRRPPAAYLVFSI
jgi:hypothetical protein